MRSCIAIAVFLSLFCFFQLNFAHGTEEFVPDGSLTQAHLVYKEHFSTTTPGVYEKGDVLFVIVEVNTEDVPAEKILRLRTQQIRGRAMLASGKALREYATEKFPPTDDPPPMPYLIEMFPALLPLLQAVESKMEVFSWRETWQYNGQARILQNEDLSKIHRYVVAISSTELKNAIPDFQRDAPDDATIERALQAAWTSLAKKGNPVVMYDALSLPEDRLLLANNELRRWVNADSICWGAFSPRRLQIAERRLVALKARPALETMKDISKDMPVSAQGLADWADSGDASPWSALNARLLTLDDEELRTASLEHVSGSDESPMEKYTTFLSTLAARPWPKLLHDIEPGPVMTAAWRTLGHANFPNTAPETETPEYGKAKELYDAGQDLPRLAKLLTSSLESSPRHAASWTLLGNALRADGEPENAIWVLTQALRLSPEDATMRASLALAYQESGHTELAVGMAASVLAIAEASEWSRKKAKKILENFNAKVETP